MSRPVAIRVDNYNGAFQVTMELSPGPDPTVNMGIHSTDKYGEKNGEYVASVLFKWDELRMAPKMAEAVMSGGES